MAVSKPMQSLAFIIDWRVVCCTIKKAFSYHILSSDDENSSGNVTELFPHMDPFDAVLQYEVGKLVDRPQSSY